MRRSPCYVPSRHGSTPGARRRRRPRGHFGEETHPDALLKPSVGYRAVVGLGVHTLFDGVAIAAGFRVDARLGTVLFVAGLLHKLPEGFTIGSVMLARGTRELLRSAPPASSVS